MGDLIAAQFQGSRYNQKAFRVLVLGNSWPCSTFHQAPAASLACRDLAVLIHREESVHGAKSPQSARDLDKSFSIVGVVAGKHLACFAL